MTSSPFLSKLMVLAGNIEGAAQLAAPDLLTAQYQEFINEWETAMKLPLKEVDGGLSRFRGELRPIRNTYYSIVSAFEDGEITAVKAHKSLVDLSRTIKNITQQCQDMVTENLRSMNPVASVENEITAAGQKPTIRTNSLPEAMQNLKESLTNEEKETQRAKQALEDMAKQKQKDELDALQIVEVKRDNLLHDMVHKYQQELQKTRNVHIPEDDGWAVTRGPVLFSSTPFLSKFQVERLHIPYSALGSLPPPDQNKSQSWIFGNQLLIAMRRPKSDSDFLNAIRYAIDALEPAFGKLAIMTPALVNKKVVRHVDIKEVGQVSMVDVVSIPRVLAFPGRAVNYIWVMEARKYNRLPPIKVVSFGFPLAPELRSEEERIDRVKNRQVGKNGPTLHQQLQEMKPKSDALKEKIRLATLSLVTEKEGLNAKRLKAEEAAKAVQLILQGLADDDGNIDKNDPEVAIYLGQFNGYKKLAKIRSQEIAELDKQINDVIVNLRKEELGRK